MNGKNIMYDIFKMSTLDFNIRVIKEFMKMVKTMLGVGQQKNITLKQDI